MNAVIAVATVGLVLVTAGLVWVTWQLGKTTARSAQATEKAAEAALRQAEASAAVVRETARAAEASAAQAEISRRMLETSVAPLLIPVARATQEARAPVAPVHIESEKAELLVTVVFRNYGAGPARVAGCNIVAAVHSYHGHATPMIVGPGEETTMRVAVTKDVEVTEQYALGRSEIEFGKFKVALSCWNLPQTMIYTTEMQLHPVTLTGLGDHQWDIKIIETEGDNNALIRTMLSEGTIPGVKKGDRKRAQHS